MKRKRNPGATAFVPNLEVIFFASSRPKKEDPPDGMIGRVLEANDIEKMTYVEWDDGTRSEVAQKSLALTGKVYRNPPGRSSAAKFRKGSLQMRKKPKRITCHVCGRYRLSKFIEWHPAIEEWQCKPRGRSNFTECNEAAQRKKGR